MIVTNAILGGTDSLNRTQFDLNNIIVTGVDANVAPDDCPDPILSFTTLNNELRIIQNGGGSLLGDLDFKFDVTVLDDCCLWYQNSLTAQFEHADVVGQNDHSAHVHELLYTDSTLGTLFGEKDRHLIHDDGASPPIIDQSGIADFATFAPRLSGTVYKDITLETHHNGEMVGVVSFEQQFYQVCPEPSSLGLAGMGLIGVVIGGIRRRRNCKKQVA